MQAFNFLGTFNIALMMGKILFLVLDVLTIIFLLVVTKQVSSMHTIVNDSNDSSLLRSAVLILLLISVSLFLTALVIL